MIDAAAAAEFTVYALTHVEHAKEILLNREAGVADTDGDFPEGSVNGDIIKRLEEISKMGDKKPD